MKKVKKPIWITILCVSLLVIAGAVFFLIRGYNPPHKDFDKNEFVEVGSGTEEGTDTAPDPTQKSELIAWGYKLRELGDYEVNFDKLLDINTDIYAWIYIPNTNVEYPVARSASNGDDSFYLEHNIYREYQFSGTIYSEIQNHPDMHDRVTVMYGHNMLNGTMFASLHNFEDKEFFDDNNTMYVITEDKVFTYLIYSAYVYDDRHILNSFFMNDDKVFEEYLDSTLEPHSYNSNVRDRVELTTDNRILTLSTCTNGPSDTRYLVQGVLVDERNR